MPYKIYVDTKAIEEAASAVEKYLKCMNIEMSVIDAMFVDEDIESMIWAGKDKDRFIDKWKLMSGKGSTYSSHVNEMKKYGSFLKMAAETYKSAQIDLLNESRKLLRK